jgi:hypothetical protein
MNFRLLRRVRITETLIIRCVELQSEASRCAAGCGDAARCAAGCGTAARSVKLRRRSVVVITGGSELLWRLLATLARQADYVSA